MLKSTFSGLQRRRWRYGYLAVVSSQICEIPRNSPKIRTYSSSRSPKVIDDGVEHTYTHSRSESWGRRRVRVDERDAVKTVPLPPRGGGSRQHAPRTVFYAKCMLLRVHSELDLERKYLGVQTFSVCRTSRSMDLWHRDSRNSCCTSNSCVHGRDTPATTNFPTTAMLFTIHYMRQSVTRPVARQLRQTSAVPSPVQLEFSNSI